MAHHPGDRVFAKIKGFSNWPARINPLPPDVQIPKGKLPVFFYGTYQVSFVPVKNIVPYEKFKEKWGKPKSNPQFMAAMQEIESNPGIFMLGEDPRAESFLLQFYTFKPSSKPQPPLNKCSKEKLEKEKVSSSPDDLSSLSDTNNPPPTAVSPRRPNIRGKSAGCTDPSAPSENTGKPVKSDREPREHSSEASSEFSSVVSKQDSADVMDDDVVSEDDDDDDDDTGTRQSQNEGASIQLSEDESRSTSITHSIDHTPETVGTHDSFSLESREARHMARKLQRKAEKKALKKAAKREAKRLLKEQERAERHARHEAKKELKRLHRLKKQQQQILASEYPNDEELSKDSVGVLLPPSPSALDWTIQAGVDHVAGGDLSPTLDACIQAELEQGNLTPLSDRPTSPLRLEDFQSTDCYEDLTMVQSVQELTESVQDSLQSSPLPTDMYLSPSESGQSKPGMKRTLDEDTPTETPLKSDESEGVHPKKRSRAESRRAVSSRNASRTSKSDSLIRKGKAKPEEPDTLPNDQSMKKSNPRSRKAPTSRRRLLSSSSSSSSNVSGDEKVVREEPSELIRCNSRSATPHEVTAALANEFSRPEEATDDDSQQQVLKSPNQSEIVREKTGDQQMTHKEKSINNRHSKSPKRKNQPSAARSEVYSQKSVESDVSKENVSRTLKKYHTPEGDHPSNSPASTDIVSQLCQLCRELKASLVRGHENFTLAVKYLSQLTTIPARLPQLAQAWDLMDCIKKCRRYKLSAEVREAAEKTLKTFHSIRSSATKEELAQTQALVAAHQHRLNNSRDAINRSKQPGTPNVSAAPPVPPPKHVDLTVLPDSIPTTITNSAQPNAVTPTPSLAPSVQTVSSTLEKVSTPTDAITITQPDDDIKNLNADLDAKMDDVLARIRAAEQRMAASAAAVSHPSNRPAFSHVTDKVYGNGHMIRASAVAAAAAHIRDEEDEESVVSRVEQVAAYEAASASKGPTLPTLVSVDSPPPPPPLPIKVIAPRSPLALSLSPVPVDLDLESRIERLITRPAPPPDSAPAPPLRSHTDNGHDTHLPAALLARRTAIVSKLAAARALSANIHDKVDSAGSSALGVHTSTPATTSVKGDDEIYDLLGV